MIAKSIQYCFFLFVTFGAIVACKSSSRTTSTESTNSSNQFQSLSADVFAYHASDDSTAIYCSINSSSLLYARKLGTKDYTSYVSFKYSLYKLDGTNRTFADSGTFYFKDIISENRKSSVFKAMLSLKEGIYDLQVRVNDVQRNSEYKTNIVLDKSNRTNKQNFLALSQSTGLAVSPSQILKGDSILIESLRNIGLSKLFLFEYNSDIKLPPAPFSIATPEIPAVADAIKKTLPLENGLARHYVSENLQIISTTENPNSGYSFVAFTHDYPEVKKKSELHPPLRYLTTKQEFENITKARNPKEKVDLFWIECGGSKDRARALIAEYYDRVQIANTHFNSYTEGWRTDRGMIYLVFGEPTKITSTVNQQTWVYGDDSNGTGLKFVFTKSESVWSDNVYILRRDPMFKTHWERMVTAWRNGRIYIN